MSETIERLRAEVERAGGGHRGYLLAAEKAVVERDAWRIRAETAEAALRIIAGEAQCADNLMSNVEVARAALAQIGRASCRERVCNGV